MTVTVTADAPTSVEAEKRVKAASKKIRETVEKSEKARTQRDAALVSLHVHEGWAPVACYKLVDVSRGLFVRMMDRAKEEHTDKGRPIPKVDNAKAVAMRSARDLARYDAVLDEQRDIRDDDVEAMLNGRIRKEDGGLYRNAEMARMTGLTTARIAQLRHGTR